MQGKGAFNSVVFDYASYVLFAHLNALKNNENIIL